MRRTRFPAVRSRLHNARKSAGRVAAVASALLLGLGLCALDGNGQSLSADQYALAFAAPPTSVRVTPDGREIVLEFAGPLHDGEAARAAKALGPLLEGYAEGYGAVRFRLTTPARIAARAPSDPKTILVTSQPDEPATPDDQRRLAMLQARGLARAGDLAGAQIRLRQLAADQPGDMEPLLTLAAVQSDSGRWQQALGLYGGVLRLFPEATDVTRDRNALSMQHAPFLRPEIGATFGPNGERAQTVTLTGDLPLGERWRGTASLQTTHDEIRGLRRAFSSTQADYSGTKALFGLGLAHDWDKSTGTTRLNLFAAPATVGVAIKHDITTRFGDTTVGVLYHQPYWGTVMAFAANARRDQVGVSQLVKLADQWQVQAGAGLIRYGIPGHDDVASGPSALAGLSKGLPASWLPRDGMELRLGYRLEAEYLSHAQTAPAEIGPLALLDTRAREIHSLYAEATAPLGPRQHDGAARIRDRPLRRRRSASVAPIYRRT